MPDPDDRCECDGWCRGRRWTCSGCGKFVRFCNGGHSGDNGTDTFCNQCWAKKRLLMGQPSKAAFNTAEMLYEKVVKWIGPDGDHSDVRLHLARAIDACPDHDAYKIARYLESSCGWAVDIDLVHLLDYV